ncbi:MAG: glycosyltransferase family 61 protein [Pseudomonadota bacterium]
MKRAVNGIKQIINARHAFGQFIPLQTLNRTLFEYDVTFHGAGDVYFPKTSRVPDAPFISLTLIPQAFPPHYHFTVRDAVVAHGMTVDPAAPRRVFMELMPNVVPSEEGKIWTFDVSKRQRAVKRAKGAGATVGSAYIWSNANWSNYYHFLLDAGIRYTNLAVAGALPEDVVFLAHSEPNAWQSDYLQLLGIDPDALRVLPSGQGAPLTVSELTIAAASRVRFACSPVATTRFRDRVLGAAGIAPGLVDRRIYVSRADAGKRRVLNEAEIWPLFEERGFEFVTLDGLSVPEQLSLFASASMVAGPHGAGLTNMIFADAPLVFELLPADRWNLGVFSTLTNVIGGQYHAFIANQENASSLTIRSLAEDNDYVVDPKRLAQALSVIT